MKSYTMVVSERLTDATLAVAAGFTLASMLKQLKVELEREGVGKYFDYITSALEADYDHGGYRVEQTSQNGRVQFGWRLLVIDSEKEDAA